MIEDQITEQILKCAFKIHTTLGPGLLESAYTNCLFYELNKSGLATEKEKILPLVYEEVKLECGYRIDLLVENKVIVELKAVETVNPVYYSQLLTYLRLSKISIGLLINFNVISLKDGIKRVINTR
jgi:GxxExxY protein